ncbi:ABC transporter permease/M1 family aminopeptidase [Zunongwangia sp. H14]|uniref:ABC transporter permease/M1 family aminopeptidase n=1 Tax=Zunongwangia sp. H14 TaxID=3240792 RepID=UPI00356AA845
MIFLKIFTTELSYHFRQIITWIYLVALLAFIFIMKSVITTGDGVYINNSFHITAVSVIGGMIWLVISANIAGGSAARDAETRMHLLTFTTPVEKRFYLGGKFFAALFMNALLILTLPIGILLSFYLLKSADSELLPFSVLPYLNVYFLILLPLVIIATAFQFALSLITQRSLMSYFASFLLAFLGQILAIATARLFNNWDLVKLLDPVGISGIVGNELQTWTLLEKNTRLIRLEGMFLWNRMLWICLAGGIFMLSYYRFQFATIKRPTWFEFRKKISVSSVIHSGIISTSAIKVPTATPDFSLTSKFLQTLKIAKASFNRIARNLFGFSLVALAAIVPAFFGKNILSNFGIPVLPTTPQVVDFLSPPLGSIDSPYVIIPLLILFFTGDLIWRDRDANSNDLIDATPISNWILFLGKFLGIIWVIFAWMLILMLGGSFMQIALDYYHFQIGLYLKVLFGIQLVNYVLFALLSMFIHILANNKSLGYLCVLLAFILISFHDALGVHHHLLVFASDPGWEYSDMRGFGNTIFPWLCFKIYWAAWAVLLAVVAILFWPRGRLNFKDRIQLAKRQFSKAILKISIIGMCLLLLSAGFIFYNTNMLNKYVTQEDILNHKAEYELKYGKYRNTLQPQLSGTDLQIELYPEKRKADIKATYTLTNKDSVEIDSIHFGSFSEFELQNVEFEKSAKAVIEDRELNYYVFQLKHALRPGDSIKFSFEVHYKSVGFQNSNNRSLVEKNATHFTNLDLLPLTGYQPNYEIKDFQSRKEHQLPYRPELPSLYDERARRKPILADQNNFKVTLGTSKNEVAVAPGNLKKTWEKGGRNYFQFETDAPLRGEYSIFSGDYEVIKTKWKEVDIRLYYDPRHTLNIDRMIKSTKSALEFYTKEFGPYPYGHFTIVESPDNGNGMHSEASMVDFGGQFALLNPDVTPEGFNLPYYIMAHEVGHQWWGGAGVTPAYVEGAGVLVEGLSVFSGMQVLEKDYGKGHLEKYIDYLHADYALPHSLASPSLLQADEPFLYYRKAGIAMHTLQEYVGQDKVNSALSQILQKHRNGDLPLVTTLDLYKELETVTPDSLNYLLNDFFLTNTYWRLKTEKVEIEELDTDKWKVILKIDAEKFTVDEEGSEKNIPMQDWIEIGLYQEKNETPSEIYLKNHFITSGKQNIEIIVDKKPSFGGIDPRSLLIDIRVDDNLYFLED